MRPPLAVVGLQWGDEGKGKIVDSLAADFGHVARFQGGHNAGHTVVVDGRKIVLHLLPSGILRPHARCYLGPGVVVCPRALADEIAQIEAIGVSCRGRLFVSPQCALVLPPHVALDRARESGKNPIGTTLRGIGPAHEDKAARRAIRFADVFDGAWRQKAEDNLRLCNFLLTGFHGAAAVDFAAVAEAVECARALAPHMSDVATDLEAARARGESILLEAAQGALLDIEQGGYPFVTAASCAAAAAAAGLGIDLRPRVLGVIKSYATRVGGGPMPTELKDGLGERLAREGEEFGATTGRARRVGWLDVAAVRHALRINGCERIAVTKLDVLDGLDEVKLCVGYRGEDSAFFNRRVYRPTAPALAAEYETLRGWQGAAGARRAADLPPQARAYLARIAELSGAQIEIVSTGADRDDIFWMPPTAAAA